MKTVVISKNTTRAALFALASSTLLAACGGMEGAQTDMMGDQDNPQTSTYSLEGSWDLSTSNDRKVGLLEWSRSNIKLAVGDGVFEFKTPSQDFVMASFTQGNRSSEQATLTHEGTLDVGVLPFDFGGKWNGTTPEYPDQHCTSSMTEKSVRVGCGYKQGTGEESFLLQLSKADTKESVFGKLGGTWTTTVKGNTCTLSLIGSHLELSCERANGGAKTILQAEIGKDDISGTFGSGEFSAKRRTVSARALEFGVR